jgi:hypothetical protein
LTGIVACLFLGEICFVLFWMGFVPFQGAFVPFLRGFVQLDIFWKFPSDFVLSPNKGVLDRCLKQGL